LVMASTGIKLIDQVCSLAVFQNHRLKIRKTIGRILNHDAVIVKAVQQKRDNDTDGKKNSFGTLAHGRNLFFYGYKSTQFRQPYESGREITLNSGNRRNLPLFSPVQSPALRTKKHSLISRKFINFA